MVDLGGAGIKLVVETLDVENQTGCLALQCHIKLAVTRNFSKGGYFCLHII